MARPLRTSVAEPLFVGRGQRHAARTASGASGIARTSEATGHRGRKPSGPGTSGQRIRIGTMDLRIASIALVEGATVLTANASDFEKVPGLTIDDWTR